MAQIGAEARRRNGGGSSGISMPSWLIAINKAAAAGIRRSRRPERGASHRENRNTGTSHR
jgi:hypothetical protein